MRKLTKDEQAKIDRALELVPLYERAGATGQRWNEDIRDPGLLLRDSLNGTPPSAAQARLIALAEKLDRVDPAPVAPIPTPHDDAVRESAARLRAAAQAVEQRQRELAAHRKRGLVVPRSADAGEAMDRLARADVDYARTSAAHRALLDLRQAWLRDRWLNGAISRAAYAASTSLLA